MTEYRNFIGGEWVAPKSGRYKPNINPARIDETLGLFPLSGEEDVDAAIEAAESALKTWRQVPAGKRAAILYKFADLLEADADHLGRILTREQGKVLGESVGEVRRAAAEARFMAGEALRVVGETYPSETQGVWIQRRREPLGVVACITPWNFPVVTPVRKVAPALAYGNTVVLKPASETPWSAVRIVELLQQAGVPDGVVNLVMGSGGLVGQRLAESPAVRGVTFTGSTDVGTRIYQAAAGHMARVQLELGGKNPAIVFDAYDVREAAFEIVKAAFQCSGQRCTAISRVIVREDEAEALTEALVELVRSVVVGDGLRDGVTMGPLVSQAQLERVEEYIAIAREEGGTILTGGTRLPEAGNGYYFAPTLITGLSKESRLMREEIFGPVLPIYPVKSVEEAIEVANDVVYGLAASVFTRDLRVALALAENIETGMVHINHGTASQPHVPFGGVKHSGQGAYSIGATAKDFYTVDKIVYTRAS